MVLRVGELPGGSFDGQSRRLGRVHVVSVVIAASLLAVTSGVTVFAHAVVANQERRLLTERANEVNLVLTNAISTVETNLRVLSQGLAQGGPAGFTQDATAQIASTQNRPALAALRPAGDGFVVVASAGRGLQPGQVLTGAPASALRAAEAGSRLVATRVYLVGSVRAVGFALRGPDGFVVYNQTRLRPGGPLGSVRAVGFALGGPDGFVVHNRTRLRPGGPPAQAGTRPFSELRVALFASRRPESSQVVVATAKAVPLRGSVNYVPLPVGSTQWLTGVSAIHPLVGSVAAAAPWVALAVGVVGSLLVFGLVEGMARRRDVAVEAMESEHRFAESLQRRLLPEVPALAGLDVASSYVPGGDNQQVGGDWFDVFELPSGQVGLVIGDVMGHDVEATAIMSQLRPSLRSFASQRPEPGWTLTELARFVDVFAVPAVVTVVYGVLDPPGAEGCRRFCWANAGHPPPLLRHPDGRVEQLDDATSPLLGAPSTLARPAGERCLPDGSTLLLYSDGLVEVKGENLGSSIDHLGEVLGAAQQSTAAQVCAAVLEAQLPGSRSDDVALLVVRVGPDATDRATGGTASSAAHGGEMKLERGVL